MNPGIANVRLKAVLLLKKNYRANPHLKTLINSFSFFASHEAWSIQIGAYLAKSLHYIKAVLNIGNVEEKTSVKTSSLKAILCLFGR